MARAKLSDLLRMMDYPTSVTGEKREIHIEVPLRISFVGGGTDVNPYMQWFGGSVISCTISKMVNLKLQSTNNDGILIFDERTQESNLFFQNSSKENLNSSLLTGWISSIPEAMRTKLKLEFNSQVLPGSGLGASSAIATATCLAANFLKQIQLKPHELAVQAYRLERESLQISGGCQDHYAAAFGGFNLFSFENYDSASVTPFEFDDWLISSFFANLTLVWTGVSRNSSLILREQISNSYANSNTKALDEQKKLVPHFVSGITSRSLAELAGLLTESWTIKKSFAHGISNAELESLYRDCINNGASGGKLLGAGGGGYFLFLSEPNKTQDFRSFLSSTGKTFELVSPISGIRLNSNVN